MRIVVAGKGPAYEQICAATPNAVHVSAGSNLVTSDVLLSVQYDKIVSPSQIDGFKAAFNLHFGLLPQYRGCFPTKWAIINGDPIGVTFHYMTVGVDEGPVIAQWKHPSDLLTDQQAYQKCNTAAVAIWKAYLPRILAGDFPPAYPQDETKAAYYTRVLPYDGKAENVPAELMLNAVRAFDHPPYPGLE